MLNINCYKIYYRYKYINIIWFCSHWLAMSNSGNEVISLEYR